MSDWVTASLALVNLIAAIAAPRSTTALFNLLCAIVLVVLLVTSNEGGDHAR